MIRRLLPILLSCLWASAAAGQTPPKTGLASLPDPGAPDNADVARRGVPSFLEEQCTPRAYMLTGQPIMDCTYWFRGEMELPGQRLPDQKTRYIYQARLELSRREGPDGKDAWSAALYLWAGDDREKALARDQTHGAPGQIVSPSGSQLVIKSDYGDFDLLVNSHQAIVSNIAVADYDFFPPAPVKLIFQRDGDNFDPAAMIRVD